MRVLALLKPTTRTVVIAAISAGLALLGVLLAIAYVADGGGTKSGQSAVGSALFALSFFACGPAMVGLSLAGVLESRPLPRSAALLGAGLLGLSSSIMLGTGLAWDSGVGTGIAGSSMCCGLPTVALLAAGLIVGVRGLSSSRVQLQALDLETLRQALEGRGVVGFAALAAETGTPVADVPRLLRVLVDRKAIAGQLADSAEAWIGPAALPRREELLGILETRGRSTEGELAGTLDVPTGVVRFWVYQLASEGRFHGATAWPEVIAADAVRAGPRACPSCGGQLQGVGRGLERCSYCGAELFA